MTDSVQSAEHGISQTNLSGSKSACQRCRYQKLKCSRERPACLRCKRMQSHCVYPEPINRRRSRLGHSPRLASFRDHRRIPRNGHSAGSSSLRDRTLTEDNEARIDTSTARNRASLNNTLFPNQVLQAGAEAPDPYMDMPSDLYPSHLRSIGLISGHMETGNGSDRNSSTLPPRAVGLSLLEIYFTRIYNAHLLFCKPILFQEYLEGRVPDALLKAIFALASIFLAPRGAQNGPTDLIELQAFNVFHSRCLPWANAATREVMSTIVEEPSLAAAQTLECLTLYWFGTGESKKGDLCLSLAYRFCSVWGYGKKTAGHLGQSDASIESELKRRCFWACWASMCIVAEPAPFVRSAWAEMAMLPLPSAISSTVSGWEIDIGEQMDLDWSPVSTSNRSQAGRTDPASAGLMKIIGVWAKIQLFVTELSSYSTQKKVDTISDLSDRATTIFRNAAPVADRTAPRISTPPESEHQVLLLEALFYLCQITLHSTIVPLFSGLPIDPQIDAVVARSSAQAALHHAELFTTLVLGYVDSGSDITHLSPIVGYGAFIAGLVLLAFEISSPDMEANGGMQNKRISDVGAIARMLDTLCIYWRPLQGPCEKLCAAVKKALFPRGGHAQTTRQLNLGTQPNPSSVESSPMMSSIPSFSPIPQRTPREDVSIRAQNPLTPLSHHSADTHSMGPERVPQALLAPLAEPGRSRDRNEVSIDISALALEEEWWSLPFAEAGSEFAGLEPISLFQQGSYSFG